MHGFYSFASFLLKGAFWLNAASHNVCGLKGWSQCIFPFVPSIFLDKMSNEAFNTAMDEATKLSLIFMAVGYASQKQAADFAAISLAANSINFAVPTHKELHESITWLLAKNLITKQGKKYSLSKSGIALMSTAQDRAIKLADIWAILENEFAQIIHA